MSKDTTSIMEGLKKEGYINEDLTVNVEKLMDKKMKTGNGSLDTGDVYVIRGEGKYELSYIEIEKTETKLGELFTDNAIQEALEPTPEEYFVFDEETGSIAMKNIDKYYDGGAWRPKTIELGMEKIIIPSTYNGMTVKKIGNFSESDQCWKGINVSDVKEVIIPNSVTELDRDAFFGCGNLRMVEISEGCTKIGLCAFADCGALATTLILPEKCSYVDSNAFVNCVSLKSLEILGDCELAGATFRNCTSLESVIVRGNCSMAGGEFMGCEKLESVEFLKAAVLTESENLTGSFENCDNLRSVRIYGNSWIGARSFLGCTRLESVELLGVSYIGGFAFGRCTGLTSISIPESCTKIEQRAFYECNSLTSVSIPESCTEMGSEVFYGWTADQTIYVPFKEGECPSGWDSSWKSGCDARIVYKQ